MNYKIKFELDLSDVDKKDIQQLRDIKIEFLTSGKSEFDILPQYKIPEKGDKVLLSGKNYLVKGFRYEVSKIEYKIVALLTAPNIKKSLNEDDQGVFECSFW